MGNLICLRGLILNFFFKKIATKSFFLNTLLLVSFFTICTSAKGQNITWDFDGGTGTDMPSVVTANVATSALSQGNNYGSTPLISTTSSSTGYTGASGNYNAVAATVPDVFNQSSSTYFEFTLTADQGYSVSITAISFGSRSTATGPKASIQILNTGVYQLQIIKPNGERELLKVKSE